MNNGIFFIFIVCICGHTADGFYQLGRNPVVFPGLLIDDPNNKTNFEKAKELFQDFLNSNKVIDHGLPESIVPNKYVVSFIPDIDNRVFDGDIIIYGRGSDNIYDKNLITLNAGALYVFDVNIIDLTNGKNLTILSAAEIEKLQRFFINIEEDLNIGFDYELRMKFSGKIRSDRGLYLSSFLERPKSPILVTEFQPTFARFAFPCWDEPKYKASFTIRLARETNLVALSNMPLNFTSEPDQNLGGKVWDTFEESPNMSTYLAAFVLGELDVIRDDKYNISIWTEPGKVEKARFSLNFTEAVLDQLEDFLGVKYTLKKLDEVAVPTLYSSAMENWGIITYTDGFLLLDDEDTEKEKRNIAFHISHEVAHQWFGNLVTFRWWNDVWLNEGFAQFFQYLIVDLLEPDWRALESFVVGEMQYILGKDAIIHTHPVSENSIETTDDINQMFDNVSYLKGGSIVRMLYHILTPEVFRKGITRYLEANSLKSVTDEDLWESFREIDCSDLDLPDDIEEIMHSWIHEKGYPVIHVERIRNDSIPVHSITLKQGYFLNDYRSASLGDNDTKWWIPLTYTTSTELDFDDTDPKEWFNSSVSEHALNVYLEEDEWIILNIQLTGFYRVNYDPLTWSLIIDDMVDQGFNDIHPLNRAELLDDAYNLALSGYVDIDVFMNLTKYLLQETDMIPWTTAYTIFKEMDTNLERTPAHPLFYKYVQWLISCWYAEVGFEDNVNDTAPTKISREILMDVACSFGHKKCHENALDNVYLMMSEANEILSTPLESRHLCLAVASGPNEVWQYVRKRLIESNDKEIRESLLDAMACSNDRNLIKQMLKESVDDHSFLPKRDKGYLIGSIILEIDPGHVDLIFDFFSENLDKLLRMFGEQSVSSYILFLAEELKHEPEKVQDFLAKNGGELKQSLPMIKSKLKFIGANRIKGKDYEKIYDWLKREEINYKKDYESIIDEFEWDSVTENYNETMENITEQSTTEDYDDVTTTTGVPTVTDDYYDESDENEIKINVTKIFEEGINDIVETATEIINKKIIPKIPFKETIENNPSGVVNVHVNYFMYLIKILMLYSLVFLIN